MLIAQQLLFLVIAKASLSGGGRVGNCFFAYAPSAHEDLRLEQLFAFARFALQLIAAPLCFPRAKILERFSITKLPDYSITKCFLSQICKMRAVPLTLILMST